MKIKSTEPRLRPESHPELRRAAELVGEFIQYWGFKSVHGRLWAYLFLSDSALNTRQLVQILKVSNALVCNSVAELQRYGVILEAGKGKNGVLLYRANPNVGQVIAGVLCERERKMLGRIQWSLHQLSKAPRRKKGEPYRLDQVRLEQLGKWVALAGSYLELGIGFISVERASMSADHERG